MINRSHHCGHHHKAHSECEYRAGLQHIWSAGNGHVRQCVSTFSPDVSKLSCNFYKVTDITESTSGTYVSELHEPQFSKLTDAVVCRPRLQKQLGQTHLFTPEQGAHFDSSLRRLSSSRRRANTSKLTRTVLPSVGARQRRSGESFVTSALFIFHAPCDKTISSPHPQKLQIAGVTRCSRRRLFLLANELAGWAPCCCCCFLAETLV